MGDNTLQTIIPGAAKPNDVNQFKEALSGDILPRNAQGEVEDKAGSAGDDTRKLANVHTQEINLYGNIRMRGTRVTKVFTSSGSWECPEGVYEASFVCAGAGGSGSSIGGVQGLGGGGGGVVIGKIQVTPATSYPVTISSGTASVFSQSGTPGANAPGTVQYVQGGYANPSPSASVVQISTYFGGTGVPVGDLPGQDKARASFSYPGSNNGNASGGGAGYSPGANAVNSTTGGGGGGYTAGSGTSGGSAGIEISYWLPDGATDPNP